jgi:endonuclease-3
MARKAAELARPSKRSSAKSVADTPKRKASTPAAAVRKPPAKTSSTAAGAAAARAERKKPAQRAAKAKAATGSTSRKKTALLGQDAALALFEKLRAHHADAHCELDHENPFQLIIATVLSAQSTDVMVNQITPELFRRWPTPEALASADSGAVEKALSRIGMFRQKTRNIINLSKALVAEHGGQVPRTLAELVKLAGVGRKTANVVLGVAFGTPEGVVVDTHVQRISQRVGFTLNTEPPEIEQDLMKLFPRRDWDMLSHVLIFHGRRICSAQRPACAACPVNDACPSAFHAENIGRKGPRRPARA